jgi:hypothetical protein
LDIIVQGFKYSKKSLGGAGTQTAALAFGGSWWFLVLQQQKNMMDQVGQQIQQVSTARAYLAGAGTQAALAFGGYST